MSVIIRNPWTELRRFTNARLALGRAGDSLPTREVLAFGLAHAQARDAVHASLEIEKLARDLAEFGYESRAVKSAVHDRAEYLRRPDLGRKLSTESRDLLKLSLKRHGFSHANQAKKDSSVLAPEGWDVVFIIADGLSAIAPSRHTVPVLRAIAPMLHDWHIGPIIIATQARVGLGDEIGELLQAEMTVMLIGERPGLSSPDSLGIYLTYMPSIGRTDADRNCISNIHSMGLSYEDAASKLHHMMLAARRAGLSGVMLKDESDQLRLP
ncbi:MAG TPA: ethanolamine ammonia-lyase subunit EutC [Pseudacidobacterium sp.]|jgi:ethanolamine ammonia-lyase small subunit|nr:ethanolamine ammonia-lyase subunit EutC [Pseudacidobacterium sp.]